MKTQISTGGWRKEEGREMGDGGEGGGAEKERKDMLRADKVEVI